MRKFEIISKYQKENINIPVRATKQSAGYDLESAFDYKIKPNEIVLVETGLKVKLNSNEALFVYPRSSLGIKKGLILSNAVGIIDADYYNNKDNEGHIMIPLLNFSQKEVTINKGERVAQGVFQNYLTTTNDQVKSIRKGGFGSSGK
ncbi:MAG: dUTP diphosphatase [Acholeplasmataceae bacterium]